MSVFFVSWPDRKDGLDSGLWTGLSTIHYFCKRRVERGNSVIDSPDSTCVIGTRLSFDAS